jgi:restriction system protein
MKEHTFSLPPESRSNSTQTSVTNDVPEFEALLLPLLQAMDGGNEMTTTQMRDAVAGTLGLGAEALNQLHPAGTKNAFDNRIGWAIAFLFNAGLLKRPDRATYVISEAGKQLLLSHPIEINSEFLRSYEEFSQFYDSPVCQYESLPANQDAGGELTPDDQIETDARQIQRELSHEVIEKIKLIGTEDLKKLVIHLIGARESFHQKT